MANVAKRPSRSGPTVRAPQFGASGLRVETNMITRSRNPGRPRSDLSGRPSTWGLNHMNSKLGSIGCAILLACGAGACGDDDETSSAVVELFVKLPSGTRYPEGITTNPATNSIYVATFDFFVDANTVLFSNKLLRYDVDGTLEAQIDFGASALLGIQYNPADDKIYIANWSEEKVQRVPADFDANTPVEDVANIPEIGPPLDRTLDNPDGTEDLIGFGRPGMDTDRVKPSPNVPIFDSAGDLYVSDSFQGAVFKVTDPVGCAAPCNVETLTHDPFLATAGFPAFGANGLAFNDDETELLICNTGDDRIMRLNIADGSLEEFTQSVDGCDGFVRDPLGRLWIAANQGDEMVRINSQGQVVEKLGSFEGIDSTDDSPIGLLFPTNAAFIGNTMYIANLAQFYTPAELDEVEELIFTFTISRVTLDF